ncbi:hypothetical protein P7H70_13595 [Vagococcus carniphilus]|uniref:Uncharacterized protein n=1 Tax=Vagococcus carniphilus TaxID=218144 RepID=A0AAW8U9T2_9ENTE|nr:hypothetical protein [Vagococcus carniphilus]MDT2835072.1 hypothetical protein [Vagococcus carniphilus]
MEHGKNAFLYYIQQDLKDANTIQYESIFQLISEYNDLEIEIEKNFSNNKEILTNIRKRNIENLIKGIENSIFIKQNVSNKMKNELKDFLKLVKKFEEEYSEQEFLNEIKIYMEIILKNRNTDFIFKTIQDISQNKLSFSDSKQLADCLIRECYHQGLSQDFLTELLEESKKTWGDKFNAHDALNEIFEAISNQINENDQGNIYVYMWSPTKNQGFKLENIDFSKVSIDEQSLKSEQTTLSLEKDKRINANKWKDYLTSNEYKDFSIFSVPFSSLPGKEFYYKVSYLEKIFLIVKLS